MIKVIDLFAGCGGFSCGFEKAGYNITSAVEFDKSIAKSYEVNHPKTKMIADDIKNVDNNNIFKKDDATIIIGGPPCQGFSMAGARIRKGFIDDPRNYLFKHYFNVVKIVRPKIFIIENVKGILTMKNGQVFNEIRKIAINGVRGDPHLLLILFDPEHISLCPDPLTIRKSRIRFQNRRKEQMQKKHTYGQNHSCSKYW